MTTQVNIQVQKENEKRYLVLCQNTNSPAVYFCYIIEESEKAYKLSSEYGTYKVWIPKSALMPIEGCMATYTFKYWFRQTESIKNAFLLFE